MSFYKVVNAELQSCSMKGPARVQYFNGFWVFPNIRPSKLLVFDSLQHAVDFVVSTFYPFVRTMHVYECETIAPVFVEHVLDTFLIHSGTIKYFWANADLTSTYNAPLGTFGCDAVKLTKHVWDFQRR